MLLSRFSTDLSVRARLIVLSIIPVVGLAAIAFAYLSSEHAVEKAFSSVQQSARMADASRAFKEALTTMQMRAKEFVAQPQQQFLVSRTRGKVIRPLIQVGQVFRVGTAYREHGPLLSLVSGRPRFG